MMRDFDTDTLKVITTFENITGSEVRDCICSETIYFLVNPGKIAIAIGKGGKNIKVAERFIKRPIKVFEWSDDGEQLIKNMIPNLQKLVLNENHAVVTIDSKHKGSVIGKGGSNIKIIREFLTRNSQIKELKVL